MDYKGYEKLVAAVVLADFQGFDSAEVMKNKRFAGIRQPGNYEIDVAVKMTIGNATEYLTIFECKFLNKKVDRPIIQKLIQTRDAISAHKCVVVTNKGYSEEAIKVASANGVGLWIVGEATRVTVMGYSGPEQIVLRVVELRDEFASLIGFKSPEQTNIRLLNNEFCHVDPLFEAANFIHGPLTMHRVEFGQDKTLIPAFLFHGSRVPAQYSYPHLNVRYATCEFFNEIFDFILQTDCILRLKALRLVDDFIRISNNLRKRPIEPCNKLPNEEISDLFREMSLPLNSALMSLTNLKRFSEEQKAEFFFDWNRTEHLNKSTIVMP